MAIPNWSRACFATRPQRVRRIAGQVDSPEDPTPSSPDRPAARVRAAGPHRPS